MQEDFAYRSRAVRGRVLEGGLVYRKIGCAAAWWTHPARVYSSNILKGTACAHTVTSFRHGTRTSGKTAHHNYI